MTQDHVLEMLVREMLHELGGLFIGKVAVPAADALFRSPRAFGISFQQRAIVVGLHEEGVHPLQPVTDEVGDEAHIAEHSQAGIFILNEEADRIDRIVRDRETLDAEILKLEGRAGLHDPPPGPGFLKAAHQGFLGERGAEEGYLMFPTKDLQPGSVVAMLVSEQNAIELADAQATCSSR